MPETLEVTPETEDRPSPPSPSNPEAVDRARKEFQKDTDEKREAQEQSFGLKEQIQKDVASQTVKLELGRREVPFNILTGKEINWLEDMQDEISRIGDQAEEEDWSESKQIEKIDPYFDKMANILEEKDTTGELDAEWWKETFGRRGGVGRYIGRLRQKSELAGMTEEEREQFQSE